LAVLAAWLLVHDVDMAARSRRALFRRAAAVPVVLVVAATMMWAVAFTAIYRRPHSRVDASRWLYETIAPGTAIAVEPWDDRLPLRVGNRGAERFAYVELVQYQDETPAKLDALVGQLDVVQYIVLSSDRLSDSIPRMPMRYPLSSKYYRLLVSGELGFDRVAEFSSYPSLGPFHLPDHSAEESFSVYDHPRVRVFRKTHRWSAGRARQLLGDVDWRSVVTLSPVAARAYSRGLDLTREERAAFRAGGTWSELFPAGALGGRWPIAVWYLTVQLLGLAAFPIVTLALRGLPDRGWLSSKALGLLLVSWGAWLLASLRWIEFGRGSLILVLAGLACAGWVGALRSRVPLLPRGADGSPRWRLIVGEELLFALAFGLFLVIRAGNPDLWHPNMGGEKPMDFAYLNAVVRSGYFPPFDPWLAGSTINYYYFGFVLMAALVKLTAVVPQVAYNLAVPTVAAFSAAGAFTAGHALASACLPAHRPGRDGLVSIPVVSGVCAAVFLTMIGNLGEARVVWRALTGPLRVPNWVWYWDATRIVPHAPAEPPPITEFPFFTFLYGDLHAHMLALPYMLAVLCCLAAAVAPRGERAPRRLSTAWMLLTALLLGVLAATNTWDYPTSIVLVVSALGTRLWRDGRFTRSARAASIALAVQAIVLVVLGRILFAPFFARYASAFGGVALWHGSHTTPAAYALVHGFFLFVLASAGVMAAVRRSAGCAIRLRTLDRAPSAVDGDRDRAAAAALIASWIVVGWLLTVVVEVFVLANDVGRMNTVFKLYFQVWSLWAVSAGVAMAWLVRAHRSRSRGAPPLLDRAWLAALALIAGVTVAYPVLATGARWRDRFEQRGFGLDGQAYMKSATHVESGRTLSLASDLEGIEWLRSSVRGTPVIAEAHTPEYRWGARISTNTGLPTILGWSWHQRQQRPMLPANVIARRADDIRVLYADADPDRAMEILRRYEVDFVYVGALERALYPPEGLGKFDADSARWPVAHRTRDLTIYRVAH
ncbi:MAG: DUF2298 domain-containing protein, partial [Vicinamibacterales bacterium]